MQIVESEGGNATHISEARLWKSLDSISTRLSSIEVQLSEVVRLEEKLNSHTSILRRHGDTLNDYGRRIHDSEIWQASQADKASLSRDVVGVQSDIKTLDIRLEALSRGQQDIKAIGQRLEKLEKNRFEVDGKTMVGVQVLKWVVGILASVIVFMLTKGLHSS